MQGSAPTIEGAARTKRPARPRPLVWHLLLVIGVVVVLAVVLPWSRPSPRGGGGASPAEAGTEAQDGGSRSLRAEIAASTSCARLHEIFDDAAAENRDAVSGTDQHRWSLGYMTAAFERMRSVGCYQDRPSPRGVGHARGY